MKKTKTTFLNTLEVRNGLAKLLPIDDVWHGDVQYTLGQPQHLCRNSGKIIFRTYFQNSIKCAHPILPGLRVPIAILYPSPTFPKTFFSETLTFVKLISHVEDARIPSLSSFLPKIEGRLKFSKIVSSTYQLPSQGNFVPIEKQLCLCSLWRGQGSQTK